MGFTIQVKLTPIQVLEFPFAVFHIVAFITAWVICNQIDQIGSKDHSELEKAMNERIK